MYRTQNILEKSCPHLKFVFSVLLCKLKYIYKNVYYFNQFLKKKTLLALIFWLGIFHCNKIYLKQFVNVKTIVLHLNIYLQVYVNYK